MYEPGEGLGAHQGGHGAQVQREARGKGDDEHGEVNAIEHRDPSCALLLDQAPD